MPPLSEFFGIEIKMEYREHNPPHVHAYYGGNKAVYSIQKMSIINGKMTAKQNKLIEAWLIIHKNELLEDWKLAQALK